MLKLGAIGRLAGRFACHRGGNFAMMAAIITPVLVLAAGYAINVGQVSITRSNLLAALDSAVTSTARDLTTGAITEEDAPKVVEAFLIANGLRAYAEEGKLALESLVIDRVARTVTAKASVDLDVAFALFGTANRQKVTAESAAIYSDKRIEVVMMLDVTGSMAKRGKTDKIGDLKAAASNAVTQLLGNNRAGSDRIRVGIVPYAEAVNVGALAKDVVFVEKEGGWDLPPPIDASSAEIAANTGVRNNNCATERKDENLKTDFSDDAPNAVRTWLYDVKRKYYAKVNRDDRLGTCPTARMVPLTTNQQQLLDTIKAFTANGVTAGGIAAQWGYYMLSPKWRKAIVDAGLGTGPADYDTRKVSKIAILMTDGEFNTAFAEVPVGVDPRMNQQTRSRNNAESICRNMKKDGIEIFTIGFALPSGESNNARRVLQNCATTDTSSIRHFHEASTGEELDAVFREIVRNIEGLALTK